MVAVLGLYEPFTHERTIVVWCVSGDGVAMLSPTFTKFKSVAPREIFIEIVLITLLQNESRNKYLLLRLAGQYHYPGRR